MACGSYCYAAIFVMSDGEADQAMEAMLLYVDLAQHSAAEGMAARKGDVVAAVGKPASHCHGLSYGSSLARPKVLVALPELDPCHYDQQRGGSAPPPPEIRNA